jgi:hypothetical protein
MMGRGSKVVVTRVLMKIKIRAKAKAGIAIRMVVEVRVVEIMVEIRMIVERSGLLLESKWWTMF